MRFFSEYSLWYVPLCIIIGVALAFLLYRKDFRFREAPSVIRTSMFVLRAFVISIVLIILLGVFVRRTSTTIEKPLVIVLQDNSESVLVTKDSSFYKSEYRLNMKDLVEKLSAKYEVEFFGFGKSINADTSITFTEKETDISQALDEISSRYYSRNVGAVILASDGIYNSGKNPFYSVQNLPFSSVLHSIVLGDSIQSKDIVIQELRTNKIAFRDNPFPIRVSVRAYSYQGKTTVLRIFHESKQIFSKPIRIT